MLVEGFSPGKLIMSDDVSLGYVQFTPIGMVHRLTCMLYPVPSDDAIYIACVYVVPGLRGRGLGRRLLDSVSRTLHRVVKGHLETPLMRLDLRSIVPLRESIQSLLERLPLPSLKGGAFPRTEPR